MEVIHEMTEIVQPVEALETEVKKFANGQPYWAKYLCSEILVGNAITDENIETAFPYLLEDLKIIAETEKTEILLTYNPNASSDFKDNLTFDSLQNVEGVNALIEKQIIEFSPNLTIVYGVNGAGKSGYVRLLKNVFYSKDKGPILENVNLETGHKSIYAEFNFSSDGISIPLKFPDDTKNGLFNQFAVFDGDIGRKHLCNRNDFSFRPAGLRLFNEFNAALEKLQTKLNAEIQTKNIVNVFAENDIFQGESEIKSFLTSLTHNSTLEELKKHLPFTEEDHTKKAEIERKHDDLKIALSQKDKALKKLREIKEQLAAKNKNLETINLWFNQLQLDKVKELIFDCKSKQETAQKEGIEKFKTEKIKNVGSPEWKQFIVAAEKFALNQEDESSKYPKIGDNCLFCQQPIIDDIPKNLIASYWDYIKSVAEQEAKNAQEKLDKNAKGYKELDLNQFSETDTLTVWLKEHHESALQTVTKSLENQKTLAKNIVSDLSTKEANQQIEIQLDLRLFEVIDKVIDVQIIAFEEDEQNKVLAELLKQKTYLAHKEKLQIRISDIETLYQNMIWVYKASQYNKQGIKTHSTNTEKRLSKDYFNPDYIRSFNEECTKLNGNFGIEIDAKSSDAQSNRQLFIKKKNPIAVLSEGEQKVIALADFIAETKITTINKGIIFDDPVNSLDEIRKGEIAYRLVQESAKKQVVIFTHDLVFVSSLIGCCNDLNISYECHWIENLEGSNPGTIWLRNTPSFEKEYKTSGKAQKYYEEARKLPPDSREDKLKNGFAALRTSYETLVVFGLFKGVVQRFEERVSVDSLTSVYFTTEIRDELLDSFHQCCRYMEGHSHSDRYSSIKPQLENLNEEIQRFNTIKKKISDILKL